MEGIFTVLNFALNFLAIFEACFDSSNPFSKTPQIPINSRSGKISRNNDKHSVESIPLLNETAMGSFEVFNLFFNAFLSKVLVFNPEGSVCVSLKFFDVTGDNCGFSVGLYLIESIFLIETEFNFNKLSQVDIVITFH